jgi:hypothetical protein
MTDSNVITLNKPEQNDPLQQVLREGARKMLAAAIEVEIAIFIEQHSALQTDEGKAVVVRNGYLPQRPIQTGLGDIEVKVPKVRDRSGSGLKFNSSLVPPYLKRPEYRRVFALALPAWPLNGRLFRNAETPAGPGGAGIISRHDQSFKARLGTGLSRLDSTRLEQKALRLCLG